MKWNLIEKSSPQSLTKLIRPLELRFENNFLAEKTKKLEAKLSQVKTQLERTSNAKLDEMLSFQKSASNRTSLGYDFSSSNINSFSTSVFVSPANNVNSENNECKLI